MKNYLHLVYSSKNRQPFIDAGIESELHSYLGGVCKKLDCQPIIAGGWYDQVHILCLRSKKITLIKLLEEVKSESSGWIKTKSDKYSNFYWQGGYGALEDLFGIVFY